MPTMTGAELQSSLELIFGDKWRQPACDWLGINMRTLERQVFGDVEPRGPVIAAVRERLRLLEVRRAIYLRNRRWLDKNRPLGPRQQQILQNAVDGVHLITGRPTDHRMWGGWEAATRSLIDRGWLDEERKITEEGRQVLAERGRP